MDEIEIILAFAIVAAFLLSTVTNFYFIRYFMHRFDETTVAGAKADEDGSEAAEEGDDGAEPASGAPSKEQILARRAQLAP